MDIIGHCLAIAPVPYLSLSWTIFQFIWTTIQEAQSSKQQLHALAESIAQLLQTLDAEIRAGRLIPERTSDKLDDLRQILDDIAKFAKVQSSYSFLKVLYKKDDRVAAIEQFHRRISATVTAFQISSLLNVRDWQTRHDAARAADQQDLVEHLSRLEKNQKELAKALNAQQNNMVAMMASLQKSILQQIGTESERRFYSQSLMFLATTSGNQVQLENWMITSFEVDFGPEIGSGGFGHVYKGTWNKTDVALKVLKTDAGVMPSLAAIRREVKTWSRLHHPHILQFLGANILDDRPFILMPYLKNGNARDYIHEHPECNRLQILYHISLGLVYLHSNNVIHGDLKALNVLIDDGGRGMLCDFGLSRMKADATSRSAVPGQGIVIGSRNWMAPERIKGGAPQKVSDIYAFGMTIYEFITLEIPLGHIGYDEFAKLVVDEDVRPERPYNDEAPDMSDGLWDLAEQCWRKDPLCRPSASIVSDDIKSLLYSVKSPAVSDLPMMSPPANLLTAGPPFPRPLPDLPAVQDVDTILKGVIEMSEEDKTSSPHSRRSKSLTEREILAIENNSNPLVDRTTRHGLRSMYVGSLTPNTSATPHWGSHKPTRNRILLHHHYGFRNSSPHSVMYQGKIYPTSEHLFQSFKFQGYCPVLAEHIRTCSEQPNTAFREARRFQSEVRSDWKQVNIAKMDKTLWHKFDQHQGLKNELLATGDAELVEDLGNSFWGVGADRQGRNELGKALERLRDKLR